MSDELLLQRRDELISITHSYSDRLDEDTRNKLIKQIIMLHNPEYWGDAGDTLTNVKSYIALLNYIVVNKIKVGLGISIEGTILASWLSDYILDTSVSRNYAEFYSDGTFKVTSRALPKQAI